MKRFIVTAFIAAAFSSPAYAEWSPIKSTDSETFSIDTASRLKTADGTLRVWAKTEFKNNPMVTEKQTYEEYDCNAGTVKIVSVTVTVKSGALVTSTPDQTAKPQPGSIEYTKMKFVCSGFKYGALAETPPGEAPAGK